ncbi:MAG: SH3 domain-containing protein [Thioalkalivibrio sp.]|nr:SH3 domain-containing protein [Thioalkalivibrio sp.]
MNTQPPTRQRKTRIGAGASPQAPQTEFIYHWNRIIGALVTLVLLIVLTGFAIHAWLSSPSSPSGDVGFDEVTTPVAQLEDAPESDEQDVGEPTPQPAGPELVPEPVAPPPEATPTTDAATLPERISPLEENTPARSEARQTPEGDVPRVFLPPDTRVNLRAAPTPSSPVLRILDAQAGLRLLEIDEAFYQVRSDEGVVGWVSRNFSSLTPYTTPAP